MSTYAVSGWQQTDHGLTPLTTHIAEVLVSTITDERLELGEDTYMKEWEVGSASVKLKPRVMFRRCPTSSGNSPVATIWAPRSSGSNN